VLNDINYDINDIETSDIISEVFVALDIHEDQHVSFEYFEVKEKVYTSVGESDGFKSHEYDEGKQTSSEQQFIMHVPPT
jgi:hypothetical protein